MKQIFSSIALIALISMTIAGLASAATDTVTATVTVSYSSVSLDQSSFAYGTIAPNTASTTLTLWTGAGITATNGGSISDFDIYSSDTTGGGTGWTLAADTTGNNYKHEFCNDTDNACDSPPTSYTAMTTSPQTLKASVAAAGIVAFQLEITTPTTATDFSEQSSVVTIQASAL